MATLQKHIKPQKLKEMVLSPFLRLQPSVSAPPQALLLVPPVTQLSDFSPPYDGDEEENLPLPLSAFHLTQRLLQLTRDVITIALTHTWQPNHFCNQPVST